MATFYYDLGSPYAWLTAERIRGAVWVPVLLGGIFRATGRSSWARTDARAAGIAEVERRARERGLPEPRWPDPWPNDGLTAMRAAAYAGSERFALEAFRVHFVEGLALSEPAHVALAAERAGLDGAEVLAATREQAVKDRLRANTEAALAAGVFGIPSVVRADGEVLWGDDVIPDEPDAGRGDSPARESAGRAPRGGSPPPRESAAAARRGGSPLARESPGPVPCDGSSP